MPSTLRDRTRKREHVVPSKVLHGSMGCFVILILISGIALCMTVFSLSSKDEDRKITNGTCGAVVNRFAWNATKPKHNYTMLSSPVRHVAIHHTTGPQCTIRDSCISRVRHWQEFHMQENKWNDIGYNFLVGGDGDIFEGRGWNHVGSHCQGFNSKSVGIGIIGDLISARPSASVLNAVESLIKCGISSGFIQKNYTIIGHAGFGVPESYVLNANSSYPVSNYCLKLA